MDFNSEFDRIISLINTKNSFVFVRYGDGESMLIDGIDVPKNTQAYDVDGWYSVGKTKLGDDIKVSLSHTEDSWYYGIPCECCNLECKEKLLKNLNVTKDQITYANLWVNSNYKFFKDWVNNLNEEIVLITNKKGLGNDYPFKVLKHIPIPDDCVNFYEKEKEKFIQEIINEVSDTKNKIFLVSAGPLSEVIIHFLYLNEPNNKYIDVGSALDEFVHKKITRPYMIYGNDYNLKICKF